ncbi:MAG: 4Fe-4S dicluster domain-containing protein [Clostridiales Family XIII bacterium]|jgi:ferredoxin|nr:4Fe-4S dicluster domain-containing protein [Clostridiales Family XIII bacterium]
MSDQQEKMRQGAEKLLQNEEVGYVIGWGTTRFADRTTPIFIDTPAAASDFVWNEYAVNSLAKYLLDDKYPDKKIGVFVRGCESRALNRMLKDKQVKRENLYLIGTPCDGKKAGRCSLCRERNPLLYDVLLWEPVPNVPAEGRFDRVRAIEAMTPDERYGYWGAVYDKCIRCYACRNACPVCSCRECYVDMSRTGFQGKQHSRSDNQIFGVTRAFHVGDRCIECGECERVCPMDLPIMGQTQKILKDINELAGEYECGLDAESENFLGAFDLDDKDEFM